MNLFRLLFSFVTDKTYRNLIIATFFVVISGTLVFHWVEGWGWIDSFYFSVITLTTTGYGDLAPQTDLGKILTVGYIMTGVGIIFGFANAFYNHSVSNMRISYWDKRKKEKKKKD